MKSHSLKCLPIFLFALVLILTFGSLNPAAAQDQQEQNILVIREAVVKGNMPEAIKFATEVRDYIKNKFPNSNLRVYLSISGNMGKIYWVHEHKSLANMETDGQQLMADPGYHAILAKAAGLFIEGSVEDTLLGRLRR